LNCRLGILLGIIHVYRKVKYVSGLSSGPDSRAKRRLLLLSITALLMSGMFSM
jgi:hypothetical protein